MLVSAKRARGVLLSLVAVFTMVGGFLVFAPASNAADPCGGYGQPACPVYTITINANGGTCSISSLSGYESPAQLPTASQCSRSGFTLTSWSVNGGGPVAPGSTITISGNGSALAGWTSNATATPTPTPTPTPTGSGTPTAEPSPEPSVAVTTPPGQTNPNQAVPIGEGVVVVPQRVADNLVPFEVGAPSETLKGAPRIDAQRGRAIQPEVSDLPARTRVSVFVIIDGQRVIIGEVRTDRAGNLELPALRFTQPGVYKVGMELPNGDINWIKIRVQ